MTSKFSLKATGKRKLNTGVWLVLDIISLHKMNKEVVL
jgi:hypothetical protein